MYTKEFPTKLGYYWFYGWHSKFSKTSINGKESKPKLHVVQVRQGANSRIYICDGHFMYKSEGAEGIWQEIEVPEFTEEMIINA